MAEQLPERQSGMLICQTERGITQVGVRLARRLGLAYTGIHGRAVSNHKTEYQSSPQKYLRIQRVEPKSSCQGILDNCNRR